MINCEYCEKKFKDTIQLNNHLNLHFGNKPFTCEQCGGTYGTKGELERHKKYKFEKKYFKNKNKEFGDFI